MGNSQSDVIQIVLHHNCYYSGETIYGSLIVLSHKVNANLYIQLKGKEQTDFKINGKYEQSIFLSHKIHIHTFTELDPINPLVFPFEIKLNSLLPSSFRYKNNHLIYNLTAQFKGIGKIKQIIKIKETKINIQQQEIQSHTIDGKLYQCRMIYKGKIRLQCKLIGNQFSFGDNLELYIQMNNDDCDDTINSIQINLINIISIRSYSQGEYTKTTNLNIQQMKATDQFKLIKINLYFPQYQLFPSINGDLISNSYRIIITPIISEIEFFDKTPILEIPIQLIEGKRNGQPKIGKDISYQDQLIMPLTQLDLNQINIK